MFAFGGDGDNSFHARGGGDCGDRVFERAKDAVRRGFPQCLFGFEVVGQRRLGDVGTRGDRTGGCTREALRGELDERRFQQALEARRLRVKPVAGDGNCMFRSIADQIYGDEEMHIVTREMCMDYMEQNRGHFEQFIANEEFSDYVARKRRDVCTRLDCLRTEHRQPETDRM